MARLSISGQGVPWQYIDLGGLGAHMEELNMDNFSLSSLIKTFELDEHFYELFI